MTEMLKQMINNAATLGKIRTVEMCEDFLGMGYDRIFIAGSGSCGDFKLTLEIEKEEEKDGN